MNLYNEESKEIKIPGFVENKNNDDLDDVDMSIFDMSDEELYDDLEEEEEENTKPSKHSRKKSTTILILGLVLIGVLFITSFVSVIFAIKEHNKVSTLSTQVTQLKAANTDLTTEVNSLNNTVEELNKKLQEAQNGGAIVDPDNKYPKGTVLYVTEAGQGMGIKKTASMESEFIDDSFLDWGDKITLIADGVKDADGNIWGQIDKGFIRIEYKGEIWCSTEEQ